MVYSSQISEIRKKRGLTQAELAMRAGITQANLCKIERGRQDLTVSTLLRICSALEVSPAEVFEEEPPPKPLRWTRTSLERVGRALAGGEERLPEAEAEVVECLKDILPGRQKRRLSSRRVYESWSHLKQILSEQEIKTLVERVRDAEQRRKAKEKEAYETLVRKLREILGKS